MPFENEEKEALLTELRVLKEEVIERLRNQIEILAFMVSAITILFGFILVEKIYILILFVPFFTITCGILHISSQFFIKTIGEYVFNVIEPKVPGLGWEHFWIPRIRKRLKFVAFFYPLGISCIFILPNVASIALFFYFFVKGLIELTLYEYLFCVIINVVYISATFIVALGLKDSLWEFEGL